MDAAGLIGLAAALAIAISTIFPALSQGNATSRAMEAISRQPEAAGDIRTTLIIALALMEALTIYGLLIALLLLGKIPAV
ncbi:MAG: ATP synthase F0 subunit C [Clostridia bacterium]|nr:ATP synthase F0 subunit C [Clostridia bacterium]MDD4146316.1 ATP synthase F0 subunit C [Clostridia bacterium]MDD4665821.1 ATP synthase F0 subunit C [Clostridia bacterium]